MIVKKFISILLIIFILFTSLPVYAIVEELKYFKYGTPSGTQWDNALHFMIRHWHAVEDPNPKVKSSDESNNHFVVVEGYIVPKEGKEGYDFYYVDQETQNVNEISSDIVSGSDYIESINETSGTIQLPIKTVNEEDGSIAEHFSGISISAGHSSIDANESSHTITVTYHPNVHLVKAHVFYSDEKITVYGSGQDDAVFGTTEQTDLQKDTAWVYTYKDSSNGHTAGDVVKGNDDKPVFDLTNLPEGVTETDIEKNKVYSTLEGLHTDKTASAVENEDRKFNLDLEAWYSGAPLADVGLVLDASGSMGFTSDDLQPININNLNLDENDKQNLVAKELKSETYTGTGGPTNEQWINNIFLDEDDVNLMLNPHNTDNSKLSASDYSYFIFDPRNTVNEYVPLGYWDGSVKGVKDKLIGYYEFNKGNYGSDVKDKRDWLINSVNHNSASLVKQVKTSEITEGFSFETASLPTDWSADKRINLNGENGLNLKNKSDMNTGEDPVGVLLDAKPTSSNFTISFSIYQESESKLDPQNYTDIVYVGSKDNVDTNYYRGIRDGNGEGAKSGQGSSSNRFRGYNNEDQVTNINSVFSSNSSVHKHTITLVFKNGTVTSYMDGKVGNSSDNETGVNAGTPVNLSDYNIIFKGFDNGYNGANLYVDNIAVFDTALSDKEVKDLTNIINSESENEYIVCNECFYDDSTEESIGVVSKYFVGLDGGTPGWYYVNYDSEWTGEYFNEDIQSCKRYWGIPKNGTEEKVTFTDEVKTLDDNTEISNNTHFKYQPEKNTPIEFYIDEAGYLRCFFTSSTKQETAHASYVYFKDDSKYVKTEALQRALGSFTTMLDEVSPNSKISAVRFSTEKIPDKDLDKLVLLDWTDDPIEAQDIMSLERGNGGTIDGTESKVDSLGTERTPITQYNYGLTGGTATYTGLKSFQDNLANRTDLLADKYLIIFTDGKDSTDKQQESKNIADQLKEEGYTIFAVMLTGGSVEYDETEGSEYNEAKKFLLTLVGNSETKEAVEGTTENARESYFYSTAEETDGTSSIDALTKIFTDQILNRITYNLYNYTVDDYIDPRFDLVSANEEVYKLNADGKISVIKTDGTSIEYNLTQAPNNQTNGVIEDNGNTGKYYLQIKLSNSSKVEASARNARIYYDSDKKMYYLKWVNQTIPGCTPNSKRLSVWNARVTIKAKDDFIGGNAVLTNGNEEKMNWVYFDTDEDKNSGTDDSVLLKPKVEQTQPTPETGSGTEEGDSGGGTQQESSGTSGNTNEGTPKEDENDEYPSKGFPRVTVNVPTPETTLEKSQLIYMGEEIDKESLSEKLMQDTYDENKNDIKQYYLEYLSRYVKKFNEKSLDDFKNKLKSGEKISIPYYYLHNSGNSNLTGTGDHEGDLLGTLEYQVVDEVTLPSKFEGEIKDRNIRKLTFTVKYIPLPIDNEVNGAPEDTANSDKKYRENLNKTLVKDEKYKWDKEYKPVVGNKIEEKDLMKSEHTTNEVSGEIALQLVLNQDVREVIDDNNYTYSIDLYRNYNDKKEKVGTFKAEYTKDKLPKEDESEPNTSEGQGTTGTEAKEDVYTIAEDGSVTILAKIEYEENCEYMKENGLPLGTYTIENPKMSYTTNLKSKLPNVITDSNEYSKELFTVGSDKETPQSYLAYFGTENNIILGYKENEEATDQNTAKKYTDYRFGLLRVTPYTYFEMPNTGSSSLVILYVLISIFTSASFILEIKKNKNTK